jgi:hypothetical protein
VSFLGSTLLLILAGYSLVLLLRVSQKHIVADIALGWFLGSGYFALVSFFAAYILHIRLCLLSSLGTVLLPGGILLLCFQTFKPAMRESVVATIATTYFPKAKRPVYILLLSMVLAVFALVLLHGKNTPTNTDDAVRLRAFTPMLVYENNLTSKTTPLILNNGIFPSFVPILSWQLARRIDHFHFNYLILTNLLFFLTAIYLFPAIRQRPQQGILNLFLVLSIPLFVYHATTTYVDTLYVIPFSLSFLIMIFYFQERNSRDFRIFLLLMTITCFSKSEGEITGITALSVMLTYLITKRYRRELNLPSKKEWLLFIPFALYLITRNVVFPNQLISLLLVKGDLSAANQVIASTPQPNQAKALTIFWDSLFSSGNFGVLFYVLSFNVAYYLRTIFQSTLFWSLVVLVLLSLEISYNAIFLTPEFTIDQSTIHRSLMILAVSSALFLASTWERFGFPQPKSPRRR